MNQDPSAHPQSDTDTDTDSGDNDDESRERSIPRALWDSLTSVGEAAAGDSGDETGGDDLPWPNMASSSASIEEVRDMNQTILEITYGAHFIVLEAVATLEAAEQDVTRTGCVMRAVERLSESRSRRSVENSLGTLAELGLVDRDETRASGNAYDWGVTEEGWRFLEVLGTARLVHNLAERGVVDDV